MSLLQGKPMTILGYICMVLLASHLVATIIITSKYTNSNTCLESFTPFIIYGSVINSCLILSIFFNLMNYSPTTTIIRFSLLAILMLVGIIWSISLAGRNNDCKTDSPAIYYITILYGLNYVCCLCGFMLAIICRVLCTKSKVYYHEDDLE